MASEDPQSHAIAASPAKGSHEPPAVEMLVAEPGLSQTASQAQDAASADLDAAQHAPIDKSNADSATEPPAQSRTGGRLLKTGGILGIAALGAISAYNWLETKSVTDASTDLQGKFETLVARVDANEKSAATSGKIEERLTGLEKRLAQLEQRPAIPSDTLATLDRRVAAVETAVKASASTQALTALERRIGSMEIASNPPPAGGSAAASQPAQVDFSPLEPRLQELSARLDALDARLSAPKSELRASTQEPLAVMPQDADPAALVVLAQAIQRALERGDSFPAELGAAEKLGADPAKLAALKDVARDGAPTAQKLALSFRRLSREIIDSATPPRSPTSDAQPQTILDKVASFAAKLVRTRPTGEFQGDDAAALVSQIEAALGRGSTSQALAVWERLPPAARTISENWASDARRSAGAEAAAQQLFATAIAGLGRKRSAQ